MAQIITTVGGGAMATVCSVLLASKGFEVRMWVRSAEDLLRIEGQRENVKYLPGVKLPALIRGTMDASVAFDKTDLIVCAVPTQYIREVLTKLKAGLVACEKNGPLPVVSVSKGIENTTLMRPTQIITDVWGARSVAALSGPNIAAELARQLPATAVVAGEDDALVDKVLELFTARYLRVYSNHDLIGVELAGALKNVIAVAAGILDGMRVGNNAKAALLTRGLVEISRLGAELGAEPETFAGLAGLGDLVTTCFSPEGRNRTFGERIGRGGKPEEVLAQMVGVVEGVATTRSVVELAQKHHVEMPISEGLYSVLFEGKNPMEGIAELMSREPKHEAD